MLDEHGTDNGSRLGRAVVDGLRVTPPWSPAMTRQHAWVVLPDVNSWP